MNTGFAGRVVVSSVLALAGPLAGCSTRRTPLISHVVFVSLNDPARAGALLDDADRSLATIPGVVSYAAGPHIDTGRATVLRDYDIGMVIGFDSPDDYAAYVASPAHTGFVGRWMPEVESLRVYDIHDPTP